MHIDCMSEQVGKIKSKGSYKTSIISCNQHQWHSYQLYPKNKRQYIYACYPLPFGTSSQQPKFKRVLQNLKIHVPFFNRKILEHPG